jgi:hypothetical protein
MLTNFAIKAHGHIRIVDAVTKELVMDEDNAVHAQNMALALARSFAHDDSGSIFGLGFGNGGTFYNSSNVINYRSPNVIGVDATLYNQTYAVQVDDQAAGTPSTNSVVALPSPAPAVTASIIVTAYLGASEPAGQAVSDNITVDPEADFVFDELGLMTEDGVLLTHCIFSPVEKTANRSFLITYTLTVSVS